MCKIVSSLIFGVFELRAPGRGRRSKQICRRGLGRINGGRARVRVIKTKRPGARYSNTLKIDELTILHIISQIKSTLGHDSFEIIIKRITTMYVPSFDMAPPLFGIKKSEVN